MPLLSRIHEANRRLNDRFFPRSELRYVDRFKQLAAELSRDGQLVLHLGSGSNDLGSFPHVGSKRLQALNLDISHTDLRKNPGRLKIAADAQALPLGASSVDLICSEHVFEHFPRPQRVLEECSRVLKEGGYLVVSGPNGWSYVALLARLTPLRFHAWVHRLGDGSSNNKSILWPTFYRFSSPVAMRRMAQKTGFEVASLQTFVGEPCYTMYLPFLHLAFIAYHKVLEKLSPIFNFHMTSVVVLRKQREDLKVENRD